MRVIGLTGGIATGKSTVARLLEQRGALVIDADQLSREAVAPGSEGLRQIAAAFGIQVLTPDGLLDRQAMRRIVFSDPESRKRLEAILHPEIRRLGLERLRQAAESGRPFAFYMAPLLIEAGAADRVDEIWVVTVTPAVQLERVMARDGISAEEAGRIIACQMSLAEKERHADRIIDNSGTVEETERAVAQVWQELEETYGGY